MKTIWIKSALLMALLASSGAITLASGDHNCQSAFSREPEMIIEKMESDRIHDFYRWISNKLVTPSFISGYDDNRVELVVRIDGEGKTKVDSIKGASAELISYVKSSIEKLTYPDGEPNLTYHFAIRFHQQTI